jgi:16S rRNA C1402 (ribose-2'-O) methylase RsmI
MKIIFLDVDGVLINRESCMRGFAKHSPECVTVLNDLLKKSDANIVVSSCWRIGRTVIELRDLFNEWGVLPGRVLDKTPHDWQKSEIRGDEIQQWLNQREDIRGDVESFVIIDDDRDMGHLLPRLVQTEFEFGLTTSDAEKALALLN